MTAPARRQVVLLGLLLVTLAGVLMWQARAVPDSAPAAAPPGRAQAPAVTRSAAPETVSDVRLELLDRESVDVVPVERDLFRFRTVAARQVGVARATPPPEFTAPPAPQGPPPIPLRLIGMLTAPTQAGRVAILSDGRGNVFNGREDDVIEGRYRVLRIGMDSIELAYTDGRGRQVIRLSGQ